jgi:hypothetical protein
VTNREHHLQEQVDALLNRSAQNRRKLSRIAQELNEFWRRVRTVPAKKRK